MKMGRELLTDEQIKREKEMIRREREKRMNSEINALISDFENVICPGRMWDKKHYMRRIDSSVAHKIGSGDADYQIKCEFCDIPGILVRERASEVRDLSKVMEKKSD